MQGTSEEQIATEMLLNSVAEKEIGRDGTTPALEFSQFKTTLTGTSPHRLEQPRTHFECGAFNHSATLRGRAGYVSNAKGKQAPDFVAAGGVSRTFLLASCPRD